eukprot:1227438-Rhodomonas_salina.1
MCIRDREEKGSPLASLNQDFYKQVGKNKAKLPSEQQQGSVAAHKHLPPTAEAPSNAGEGEGGAAAGGGGGGIGEPPSLEEEEELDGEELQAALQNETFERMRSAPSRYPDAMDTPVCVCVCVCVCARARAPLQVPPLPPYRPTAVRARYALSGTDVVGTYGCAIAISGTDFVAPSARPMWRYAVLTRRSARAVCYGPGRRARALCAVRGTDV